MPAPAAPPAPPPAPPALDWTDAAHPLWTWLLWTCALATALPLWTVDHLPFTDLPQHAAAIASLRHWWDPAWRTQEHFTLALGQTQYLLYYLAGAALAFPLGTAERANLVLLSLTAVALPLSLRALLRALRADPRLALFACTLFWTNSLLIGFFNYLAAMPLLLWGLALALEQAQAPSRRTAWKLGAASLALFYLHLSAFLVFAPACALAFWVLPGPHAPPTSLGRALALPQRALWAFPSMAAALLFLLRSPVVHPGDVGWHQDMAPVFEDVGTALRHLPDALLDIWSGPQDEWALLALLAALVLVAWPQQRDPEDALATRLRGLCAAWAALAAILYFAFPISIGWMWQLNERYALVVALLVPALLRPARGLRGAAPLLLAAGVSLFAANTARQVFRGFEGEVGPFDHVLAQAAPGKHLLGMIVDQNSRFARFSPFLQFAAYYRARMGGVASFSFAELPQSPLRYRPEAAPPVKRPGWEWHAFDYSNPLEGPYYDYLLIHGNVELSQRVDLSQGPQWRLVTREGRWSLYARAP